MVRYATLTHPTPAPNQGSSLLAMVLGFVPQPNLLAVAIAYSLFPLPQRIINTDINRLGRNRTH